jgi:sugar lactone lactonase YvrE
MDSITAELVYQNFSDVGESCLWDEQNNLLYWVDIHRNQLFTFDPVNNSNLGFDVKEHIGSVVLREKGGMMLALKSGFASFDPKTGKVKNIVDPESSLPNNRFNDGKCDPQGRFWAGTMAYDIKLGAGSLYCMDLNLEVSKKIENITISNGLAWNQTQDKFHFIDSISYSVDTYDFSPKSGEINNKQSLRKFSKKDGLPDGMTIDSEDHIWVALFGGGKVIRLNPETGETVFEIITPGAQKVTSCTFGGADLDELYITTASTGVTKEEWSILPNSGGLFRIKVPFKGVINNRFKG